MKKQNIDSCRIDLSDEDIFSAMKEIGGYLDITPGDFKEIYGSAFRHAYRRLTRSVQAKEIMSSPAETVQADAALSDISTLLSGKNIRRIPVTDNKGLLIGIVTRSDLVMSFCSIDE